MQAGGLSHVGGLQGEVGTVVAAVGRWTSRPQGPGRIGGLGWTPHASSQTFRPYIPVRESEGGRVEWRSPSDSPLIGLWSSGITVDAIK